MPQRDWPNDVRDAHRCMLKWLM